MQNNPSNTMSSPITLENVETGSAEKSIPQQVSLVTIEKFVQDIKVVSQRKKHAPKVDSSAIIEGKRRRMNYEAAYKS